MLVDELIVFPGARRLPEQRESNDGLPAFYERMRAQRFDLAIQLHGSGGIANDLLLQFGARCLCRLRSSRTSRRAMACSSAGRTICRNPAALSALMSALGADTTERHLSFPLSDRGWR